MPDVNSIAPAARGHHWFLDLADCQCESKLLSDAVTLREFCLRACQAAGMRVVGDVFHQFSPVGVTGVVLLAESHLSVHTWPELRFVAVDVYVCDFDHNNASRGQALTLAVQATFQASSAHVRDHARLSVPQPVACHV